MTSRRHTNPIRHIRPSHATTTPHCRIPAALEEKFNDLRNFFEPELAAQYYQTTLTRLSIPDFGLTFGAKGDLNKVRNLRSSFLAKLQTTPNPSSTTDTAYAAYYTMLTLTIHTVFKMSVDPKRAWTRYTQGAIMPHVVLDYAPDSTWDLLAEVQAHLQNGSEMKIISLTPSDAVALADDLVKAGINHGVFVTKRLKNHMRGHNNIVFHNLPVYTNLLSPHNFDGGVYITKTLPQFPASALRDVQTLMSIIKCVYASESIVNMLNPSESFLPVCYIVNTPKMRLMTVTYQRIHGIFPTKDEALEILHQGQTTILSGTTPERIEEEIRNADKVDFQEATNFPIPNSMIHKVKNLSSQLSVSKLLIIIGQKASGKSTFMKKLPAKYYLVDSDDFSNTLSVSLEAALSAIIALCSAHRIGYPSVQLYLGQLMRGEEVKIHIPGGTKMVLDQAMALAHKKYMMDDDVPGEVRARETDLIYNIMRTLVTVGYALDQSYLAFCDQLKKETRPMIMNVHTDSEAVAIRAVLRRGTVVSVVPSIMPSNEMLNSRPRNFKPFQMSIMALYTNDIICDGFSFDALRHAILKAW